MDERFSVTPALPDPQASQVGVLPAATYLGPVELTVTNLGRSIGFYTDVVGLEVHSRDESAARLGTGTIDSLVLYENATAKRQGRHAGIFHVALLYPSRLELARVAQRILVGRTPIQGASDHGTHEAIYLPDPDGIGLELAWDRPREQWPDIRDVNAYAAGPQPLDLAALLALVEGDDPVARVADGLRVGHVHLHVGDIEATRRFYTEGVGFEEQVFIGSAAFVSAGGYHHHVAFNTWQGSTVPPVPDDVVGMRHFTLELPSAQDVDQARARISRLGGEVQDAAAGFIAHDPVGNAMMIRVASQ